MSKTAMATPPSTVGTSGTGSVRIVGAAAGIQNIALGLLTFLGGFVFFEPAPYELFLCFLIVLWAIFGIRIPRTLTPLLILLVAFNAGGLISSFQIEDLQRGLFYSAVSFFLALSTLFFAIVISDNPSRFRPVFIGYVLAAILTSLVGIAGYFETPGFELFVRYLRVRGGFEDPNVFAPFIIVPMLLMMHKIIVQRSALFPVVVIGLLVLVIAQLLAFSRASWGLSVLSISTFLLLLFIEEQRARVRLRYLLIAALGIAMAIIAIVVALQFEQVASLLEERARIIQPYDSGELGRFGRHKIAAVEVLFHPLGYGPLEFGYRYGEHVHNSFLKAGLAYGWIGFFCWIAMMIATIAGGTKLLFRKRPWQHYLQICWIVFFWHVAMSYVIDIDHWRHFYLIMGVIWACMILEARWQRTEAIRTPGFHAKTHNGLTA